MRAATVGAGGELAAARALCDLLVQPNVDGIDIRDWEAYEPGVQAGYDATRAALDQLSGPLTEIRKRQPRAAP